MLPKIVLMLYVEKRLFFLHLEQAQICLFEGIILPKSYSKSARAYCCYITIA